MVDGLGHGYESSVAAERAVEVIREFADLAGRPDPACAATRSCAPPAAPPSACSRSTTQGAGEFCGIGNIEVQALNGQPPSVFCLAGIVGHNLRTSKVMPVTMKPGDIYCLMSDGISTRGNLKSCLPGPPETVARRIVEHWGRDHDDATALVVGFGEVALLADGAPTAPPRRRRRATEAP